MKGMKKDTNRLILILSTFFFSAYLPAQVTVVGHITAEVVSTLAAEETCQLSFGQFSSGPTGGSIILTAQGTRTATGSVNILNGMNNPGSFLVTGEPDASISMQLPSETATLTNSVNEGKMTVTNWVTDNSKQNSLLIPKNGSQQVNIGATLFIGGAQETPAGIYKGTFNITFNYN